MNSSKLGLLNLTKQFVDQDPSRAAHFLETMDEDQVVSVLKSLPVNGAATIFSHFQNSFAANLFKHLSEELVHEITSRLDMHQIAALVMAVPAESRQMIWDRLPERNRKHIQELLTYPENSAGRIMSLDFIAFHTDVKAKDAMVKIRAMARRRAPSSYAYVVDRENHLVGIMNMHDLIIAPPDSPLEIVMRKNIFSVNCFMDREQVAEEFSRRKYFAMPVVDNESRLLGIVKADQLIEDVQEEATEDIQKMFGAGGDERAFSSMLFSLRMRLPWLYVNLATAFLAGSVIALFNNMITLFPVLAVYLPVVAGQGGNAGAQSLVVVIRGLVMREIPARRVSKLILKEVGIGMANGIMIGLVTAAAAWLWHGNPYLGVVVGLAMLVNLMVAGLTGAAIPLIMKSIGLDPAQCSNIILTTFTDVMGFFSLLCFAMAFQKYL